MIDDAPRPAGTAAERKRFLGGLAVVLALTAGVWIAYGLAQPRYDPRHGSPAFDAAYYVAWSDAILSGPGGDERFEGAFYRAPLYPYLMSLLRAAFGAGQASLQWIQILVALAVTGWLARESFRWGGTVAGLGTAVLLGAYHPWLFFSARLLGECWAMLLLVLALSHVVKRNPGWAVLAGALAGLAALARPNLLLVAAGWGAWAIYRGERAKGIVLLLATAATVLPATAVNWHRSGHFVPISANGGLTLYHGNGPGAQGVFTHAGGMSGAVEAQRREATATASRLSGRELDAVEADRYWGRRAVRHRWSDPLDTLDLAWTRLILLLGTREIALDEPPALDPNPWSRAAFVPFALLLGLSAAAIASRKRAEIAAWSWIAVAACAATPWIFYVSSRYRLPCAVLLALPAGVGLAELLSLRARAIAVVLVVTSVSLGAPWIAGFTMQGAGSWRAEHASGYAQLARAALDRAADLPPGGQRARWAASARGFLEKGRRFDPGAPELLVVVARVALDEGRTAEAEAALRRAWESPGGAPAARLGAALELSALWIREGRASAAANLTSEALELAPLDATCWNHHIVALLRAGRTTEARRAAGRARSRGVAVDPELDAALSAGDGAP